MSRYNLDRIEGYEKLSPELAEKLTRHRDYLSEQIAGLDRTIGRIDRILQKPTMD